jgi:hypothetical protein
MSLLILVVDDEADVAVRERPPGLWPDELSIACRWAKFAANRSGCAAAARSSLSVNVM